MKLIDALNKLKSSRNRPLNFLFCEQGKDGKPLLIIEPKPITPDQSKVLLEGAKSKTVSKGKVLVNDDQHLVLEPKGLPPKTLTAGVKKVLVAQNLTAQVKDVRIQQGPVKLETVEEEDEGFTKERIAKLKKLSVKGKYPDPILSNPVVRPLIDAKEKAQAALARAVDQKAEDAVIDPLVGEISRLNGELDKYLGSGGVLPKERAAEYDGEFDKLGGWRAKNIAKALGHDPEKIKSWVNKAAQTDMQITRKFTDEQREDSKLHTAPDGTIRGKHLTTGGAPLPDSPIAKKDDDHLEYVMDTDGQMHQFKGAGTKTGKNVNVPGMANPFPQDLNTHHSSVLGGKEVAGAGTMGVSDGKITRISNASGHYKPGVAQLLQTVETLLKQGALLDKTYTDAQGSTNLPPKIKELADAGNKLEHKLYEDSLAMMKLSQSVKPGVENYEEKFEKLQQTLEGMAKSYEDRLGKLEKVRQALEKLGFAPGNKISDAQVDYVHTAGKTGLEVRVSEEEARQKSVDAATFLRTGGGNKDNAAKTLQKGDDLRRELKAKMGDKRAELDKEANKRSKKIAETLKPYLEKLQDRVKQPLPANASDEMKANRERQLKFLAASKEATPEELVKQLDELKAILAAPAPQAQAAPPSPAASGRPGAAPTQYSSIAPGRSTASAAAPVAASGAGYSQFSPTASATEDSDDDSHVDYDSEEEGEEDSDDEDEN